MLPKAPDLADCNPGIEPVDVMVLVAPCETPKVSPGGIILPGDETMREEFAQRRGRIVAVSPMAFTFREWPAGFRKPQVGDLILHDKYAGGELVKGADGKDYRLMQDKEVKAVLERAPTAPTTAKYNPLQGANAANPYLEKVA